MSAWTQQTWPQGMTERGPGRLRPGGLAGRPLRHRTRVFLVVLALRLGAYGCMPSLTTGEVGGAGWASALGLTAFCQRGSAFASVCPHS